MKLACLLSGQLKNSKSLTGLGIFKKIMNNLPVAMFCADKNNNIIFSNKKFKEVIGYSIEDIPTIQAWLKKSCPDEEARKHLLDSGFSNLKHKMNDKSLNYTINLICGDGTTKDFDFTCFMEGEFSYAVFNDITDRLQAENELRSSRETLSLAAELACLGPWKFNVEKNMFEFGDEFYAIYGTDVAREGAFMAPEVYAREFVHPDDAWVVDAEVKKARESTERHHTGRVEHRIIHRDGEERIIAVMINFIKDADGNFIKWYGANQDITEYKRTEEALRKKTEKIEHMAYTDALTGLPNRAHLIKRLEGELEKACRDNSWGAVLFIDLDNLKMINDAFGHTYGDALITTAGKRIVDEAGSSSFVGRIGGDEFVVILPLSRESNRQCIELHVNKIIEALSQDIEILGVCFHISASAGAAIYPYDGDTVEELFKNADNAMYAAKEAGKNCWRFYEKNMKIEVYKKMLLTNRLYHAVECGELTLYYQPQVFADSGDIVGFEALLRWNCQGHGFIPPVQFIPLAEQTGLIHTIGEWVLREACRFARRLVDQGWRYIHVAVNVSTYQLCTDRFIDIVCDALHDFGVEPGRLHLEITETALIASIEEIIRRLKKLQRVGVQLALDDFGTGYSSLIYLQYLPVKIIKIDKSFMDMIPLDGAHQAIIENVVNMAHTMGMTVIAEGVEKHEQLDYLVRINCDCVQGYFFSRPLPEEDAVRFLSRDFVQKYYFKHKINK